MSIEEVYSISLYEKYKLRNRLLFMILKGNIIKAENICSVDIGGLL